MIWFVSRHQGAQDWALAQGLHWDRAVAHLTDADLACMGEGDDVFGLVPAHVAARLCARGVRYWHLATELPQTLRGRELSAAEMAAHGARFVRLQIQEMKE
jgi:CRISPR-associated protein Csx16